MYSDWVVFAAVVFLLLWLGFLSFVVWQQNRFIKSLFPKSGERDIRKKFAEIIKTVTGFKSELSDLDDRIEAIKIQDLQHIQRMELLRFNPYDDTGGNISFTVCFLDSKGSGIVMTSLHARSGTRVFGKEIVLGKSIKYELSKEEEAVIKKAMKEQ
ncbi:DUF4446 family protein [Patescibacteria group bacterium]|nr:DUF4446 family protein [Patescibacteria group bacterium]